MDLQIPAGGGNSTHKLTNGGAEKLMFKVKSSNNNEYRQGENSSTGD